MTCHDDRYQQKPPFPSMMQEEFQNFEDRLVDHGVFDNAAKVKFTPKQMKKLMQDELDNLYKTYASNYKQIN